MESNKPIIDQEKERKHSFPVDVLRLTSGTVLAQVVSVFAAPVIARLFAPEAFGVAAIFTSLTGIIGIVICLRYDRSIIVPQSDEDAVNLVGVSFVFTVLVATASTSIVFLGGSSFFDKIHAQALTPYLRLVPFYLFASGILAALASWGTRKKHFTAVALSGLLSSICYIGVAICAGMVGHVGSGTLIVGICSGMAVSVFALVPAFWRDLRPSLVHAVSRQNMLRVLHRYQRFPKFSTAAALLNSASWELPTFFLSGFFSTAVVGEYALGQRLIRIPMSFIGLNISRVFSQRAAQSKHEGTLPLLVSKTFQSLVNLGLFPFLLAALTGREVFTLIFGARWTEAGVYTEILSAWAFFWFISAPLACLLDILDEQAFELRMNVLILVSRVISLSVGGYLGNARLALGLFSASGVLVYGYYCLAIVKKGGVSIRECLLVLGRGLMSFVPSGAAIVAARMLGAPPLLTVTIAVLLLAIYYLRIVFTDPEMRNIVFSLLRKPGSRGVTAVETAT